MSSEEQKVKEINAEIVTVHAENTVEGPVEEEEPYHDFESKSIVSASRPAPSTSNSNVRPRPIQSQQAATRQTKLKADPEQPTRNN